MNASTSARVDRRTVLGLGAGLGVVLVAGGCAPSGAEGADPAAGVDPAAAASVDADFDLDALVSAAKQEGALTVYDSSGDITHIAENFAKKYGIDATGVKSKVGDTLEKMTREYQADKVTIDATLYSDGPTLAGQLIPQKVVYTWIPADLLDDIPEADRSPLDVLDKADVFVYNNALFPDGSPITNLWDLTTKDWRGKVTMQDPLGWSKGIEFFNQLTGDAAAAKLAQAYQDTFGQAVSTSEANAGWEWIKRLATNAPILTKSDEDAAAAVGAPNQTRPRVALMSTSKFRDVEEKKYNLKVCSDLKPWGGLVTPKFAAIATKTSHPNAAKLFIHFVLTQEGIAPEISNGGAPTNTTATPGPNPPGLESFDGLFHFDSNHLIDDFHNAQKMQDFWRTHHG